MTDEQNNDTGAHGAQEHPAGAQETGATAAGAGTRPMTLLEAKTATCSNLRAILMRPLMMERLLKMVGGDESKIAKYMTSWFAVLMQDDGGGKDNKKYYIQCTTNSLITCFLESVNMQLPFDSRKLVSMIIYDNEVELDISYKGFVNALSRKFTNAFVECKLVFAKDHFEADIEDRRASYKYKPADAFANIDKDFTGIKGGYCFFSYTDTDGEKTSRLVFLSRDQIMANRKRARQHYVWNSDPKAMGEKTCIREGARLPFASIDLEVDVEHVDNKHYKLEKADSMARLENLIKAQDEATNEKPKPDPSNAKPSSTDGMGGGNSGSTADSTAAPQASDAPDTNKTPVSASAVDAQAHVSSSGTIIDNDENAPVSRPGAAMAAELDAEDSPKPQITDADFDATPGAAVWDGRTVYLGAGKTIAKDDFASALQAGIYIKKVISQRTQAETRQHILGGNALLIAALHTAGYDKIIEELNLIASQGTQQSQTEGK